MHVYIDASVCICMSTHAYIYSYVHMYVCMHICVCAHACACICAFTRRTIRKERLDIKLTHSGKTALRRQLAKKWLRDNNQCILANYPIWNTELCQWENVVYRIQRNKSSKFYVSSTTKSLHIEIISSINTFLKVLVRILPRNTSYWLSKKSFSVVYFVHQLPLWWQDLYRNTRSRVIDFINLIDIPLYSTSITTVLQ